MSLEEQEPRTRVRPLVVRSTSSLMNAKQVARGTSFFRASKLLGDNVGTSDHARASGNIFPMARASGLRQFLHESCAVSGSDATRPLSPLGR